MAGVKGRPGREKAMKRCKYCGRMRPEEDFEVCRVLAGRVYRRLRCKRCKRATTNLRRRRLREWVEEYKKRLRCERRGFADHRALEFHHRDPAEEDVYVADMVRSGLSLTAIKREIEKCEVLCSNCHLIEHYERRWAGSGRQARAPS
jgi:hypothetical protein